MFVSENVGQESQHCLRVIYKSFKMDKDPLELQKTTPQKTTEKEEP